MSGLIPNVQGGRHVASSVSQITELNKNNSGSTIGTDNVTNDQVYNTNNFQYAHALGDVTKSSGKRYFENYLVLDGTNGDYGGIGLVNDGDVASALGSTFWTADPPGSTFARTGNNASFFANQADDSTNGWDEVQTTTLTELDLVGAAPLTITLAIAVDLDNGYVWFGAEDSGAIVWTDSGNPVSGTGWQSISNESMNVAPCVFARQQNTGQNSATICTGSDTCAFSPPSGFDYWDAA